MNNNKKISIIITGVNFVGKTTQVNLLNKHYEDSERFSNSNLSNINTGTNKIIIIDDSELCKIAKEISDGVWLNDLIESNSVFLQKLKEMSNLRQIILINLNLDDLSTLQERIDKYNKITKSNVVFNVEDKTREAKALSSVSSYFPVDSMHVRNLTFTKDANILEIHEEIKKIVDNYL